MNRRKKRGEVRGTSHWHWIHEARMETIGLIPTHLECFDKHGISPKEGEGVHNCLGFRHHAIPAVHMRIRWLPIMLLLFIQYLTWCHQAGV